MEKISFLLLLVSVLWWMETLFSNKGSMHTRFEFWRNEDPPSGPKSPQNRAKIAPKNRSSQRSLWPHIYKPTLQGQRCNNLCMYLGATPQIARCNYN
jgi:hypothetical protein